MKWKLLFVCLLLFTLSCSKDKDKVIPGKKEPINPALSDYPVESHFPAGSDNQPFPDLPVDPDLTKSATMRLIGIYYFRGPNSTISKDYILFDYDQDGNIVTEIFLSGSAQTIDNFEYQNGRLYKKTTLIKDSQGSRKGDTYIYSYADGKLSRVEELDPHGIKRSDRYYLYARNRLIYSYIEGSELNSDSYKYFYDEKGRLIREETYRRKGLIYTKSQAYDDQDRIITQQGYVAGKDLYYSAKLKYELANKKPSEEAYYNQDNALVNKIHWTYQEQGFPLSKMYEDTAGLNPLELNRYENGVIVEKRTFDSHFEFSESVRTRYVYEMK